MDLSYLKLDGNRTKNRMEGEYVGYQVGNHREPETVSFFVIVITNAFLGERRSGEYYDLYTIEKTLE